MSYFNDECRIIPINRLYSISHYFCGTDLHTPERLVFLIHVFSVEELRAYIVSLACSRDACNPFSILSMTLVVRVINAPAAI